MDYPEYVARFYDVIYDQMRTEHDKDYYMEKIASTSGTVLEIGSGTGRFFSDALGRGADIYGIDTSEHMLSVLKQKIDSREHHRVSRQSAVDFHFDWKFELILAPFRVLSHVLETDDQLKALNCVARHLSDTGRFIFDVFIPDPGMIAQGLHNVVDFEGEYAPGRMLKRTVNMSSDIVSQISDINMRFDWDEDERNRTEEWHFRFRYYFRYEVEHLISRSDLEVVKISGDFSEGPLQAGSRELIVECKRKKELRIVTQEL